MHVTGKPRWLSARRVLLPRCILLGAMGCLNECIKRSDVVGRVFLLGTCFDYMDVEMIATGIGLLVLARICAAISNTVVLFGRVINMDGWAYTATVLGLLGTVCLAGGVMSFAWRFLP